MLSAIAAHDVGEHERVARPHVAAHRHARKPERQLRCELGKLLLGARAAGAPVGDQADAVAARDLLARKIEHVAEQAADRRAEYVENVQRPHGTVPARLTAILCGRAARRCVRNSKWLARPASPSESAYRFETCDGLGGDDG